MCAFSPVQAFLGIAQFVVVVVASIIIGLVMGMAGAFFTRFTEHVHGECTVYSAHICVVLGVYIHVVYS